MADVTAGELLGIKAPGAGQTVRLPVMLLDTDGDPVTGVAYNAAGVTIEIAKPGEALSAWATVVGAAFATSNWAEIGRGNYDIILSGDVAGEAAVLNTVGDLRVYVAFSATRGDTFLYRVVPADAARDDQWTDARAESLDTIAADVAGLDGAAMRGTDGAYTGTPPTVEQIQSGLATATALETVDTVVDAIAVDVDTIATDVAGLDGAAIPTVEQVQTGLATAAGQVTADGKLDAIQAKTDNIPASPAATGDAMTLAPNAITAATIAAGAIADAALAADMDTYGARVEIIDDDGAGTPADRYCVTWLKNMEMLTTGVTEPKIQVIKLSDGTDLVAETALAAVGSTGAYQYVETANRIVDGAAYMVLVTATIAAATRTWPHFIGRDSVAA